MKNNNFQITIDSKSGLPPYRQIINQVKLAITSNIWKEDEPLPSIREMAEKLGIAPLTIAKAYLELEHMGLIKTRWGKGSFVTHQSAGNIKKQALAEEKVIEQFLDNITTAGFDPQKILNRLTQQLSQTPEVNNVRSDLKK
ncbi:MAG: GntR family transcriptional regulator [Planctomycetota bacterium]